MIHCMRFLIFVALVAVCTASTAVAQGGVSDTDFFSVSPVSTTLPNEGTDTTFIVSVNVTSTTPMAGITLPLGFTGHANLRVDTTIVTAGNKGVTWGPLGNDAAWTVKSSLVDNSAKTILIGLISFGSPMAPSSGTLVNIHFDYDASAEKQVVTLDSTFIAPSNNLSFNDEAANTYVPQWASGTITIGTLDVGDRGVTPLTYGLDQNYPNPFNAGTKVSFSLAAPGKVDLKIYNTLGQAVKVLLSGELPQGLHNIVWDGTNNDGEGVGSGTYFYRLKVGDVYEETRQMTLLK